MIRFASFLVPLLLASLVFVLYKVYATAANSVFDETLCFSTKGIALSIACSIAAVIDMPTFFRHAKSKSDAIKASTLIYFLGLPLIESLGLFIGLWSSEKELLGALICHSGAVISSILAFIIVFAGWATNNVNFYSSCAGLSALFPQFEGKKIEKWGALFSTALSMLPILASFDFAIEIMGILWASLGAPVLCGFVLEKCSGRPMRVESCLFAAIFGAIASTISLLCGGIVFSIPLLDGFFGAAFLLLFTEVLLKKVQYEIS